MSTDDSTSEGDENPPKPIAGLNFPWENISGACLRFVSMLRFADLDGDRVGSPTLGAYGLAEMELPNPDVSAQQRLITVPIKTKGDYKSICRAQLDRGVGDGSNELVVVYEHRRGFFGGAKPGLHVAAYPAGTWDKFFDAVSHYKSQDFVWPSALFLYQPTATHVFPARNNLFCEDERGTPSLTILILALLGFSLYRFWLLGWAALPGNLRLAALAAIGLGVAALIFGPLWTFGVRSRKNALILLIVAAVAFVFLNAL